jgi:hypothetical protein
MFTTADADADNGQRNFHFLAGPGRSLADVGRGGKVCQVVADPLHSPLHGIMAARWDEEKREKRLRDAEKGGNRLTDIRPGCCFLSPILVMIHLSLEWPAN